GAAATLKVAYETLAEPRLLYNIARAYERAGDDAAAASYYQRYVDGGGTEPDLRERAVRALERLRAAPTAPRAAAPIAPPAATAKFPPPATSVGRGRADEAPEPPSHLLSNILMVAGGAAIAAGIGIGIWASTTASDARGTTDPKEKPRLRDAAKGRALGADIA